MAYIRKRKNSYSVVYRVKNAEGIEHQKSESYATQKEAEKRKKEIEKHAPHSRYFSDELGLK